MGKKLILLFCILINLNLSSQVVYSNYIINPFQFWSQGSSILLRNDTVYILGNGGDNAALRQYFVGRLEQDGSLSEMNIFGNYDNYYYSACGGLLSTKHGFITGGTRLSQVVEGYISKLDNNLQEIDSHIIHFDTLAAVINSIVQSSDSGAMVCGYLETLDLEPQNRGILVYKVDSNLEFQWYRILNIGVVDQSYNLINTSDNSFIICGITSQNIIFTRNPLIIKTDSSGNMEWYWDNGSIEYDDGPAVACKANNGGYIVSYGHATYQNAQWPPTPSDKVIRVLKLSNDGQEQWSHTYWMSNQYNKVENVIPTTDNGYLINYTTSIGDCQMSVLLKINSVGDSIWQRFYIYDDSLGSINEFAHIIEGENNSIYAIGQNFDGMQPGSEQSVWLLHLDSLGCDNPDCNPFVGIRNRVISNSLKIFPNPATEFVTLIFDYWEIAEVKIKIVDNNGNAVRLIETDIKNGEYKLNIHDLSSGIYYLYVFSTTYNYWYCKLLKI